MRHYCTLFDSNYLTKGLCLIESMFACVKDFKLHVLALDDAAYDAIPAKPTAIYTTLLKTIQDLALLDVRRSRTWQEYCWTLASVWLKICLSKEGVDAVTYLDADSFFFGDPQPAYDEIGDASVALVPHKIIPSETERFRENGNYNVNFVYVKNDDVGRAFANEWSALCLARCTLPGADQAYLDDLATRYPAHEIQHRGINLAPWNQGQYAYELVDHKLFIDGDPLIFYHFHEFRSPEFLTGWPLHPRIRDYVYGPYIALYEYLDAQRSR